MKEAIWGVLIVVLGLFGILVVNLFQNVTVDNDRVYYLIKETTQAAAYDAIDLQYYRTTGNMKIAEDKFIENLTRRFAQNVTVGDYTIIVEDLNEVPPKISLRIRSGVTSLRGEEFGLVNRVDGVIEAKYKIDEVIDFLCEDKTAEECNTIRQEFGVKVEIDSSSGENRCASDISDEEMDCIPGDISFLGWGESDLPIGICQDEEAPRDKERTARYAICECGKWSSEKEKIVTANPVSSGNEYIYTWTFSESTDVRTINESIKERVRKQVCTTDIKVLVPKNPNDLSPETNPNEPSADNSSYVVCPVNGIYIPSGTKVTLHPKYVPANASNRKLEWTSSDTSILTIQKTNPYDTCELNSTYTNCLSKAVITAQNVTGTKEATITVKTTRGQTSTCKVKVWDGVPNTLGCNDLTLEYNGTGQMQKVYEPKNSSKTDVKWSLSDTTYATINENTGEVTANNGLSPIDQKITVTVTSKVDSTKTGTCTLTVKGKACPTSYPHISEDDAKNSISCSSSNQVKQCSNNGEGCYKVDCVCSGDYPYSSEETAKSQATCGDGQVASATGDGQGCYKSDCETQPPDDGPGTSSSYNGESCHYDFNEEVQKPDCDRTYGTHWSCGAATCNVCEYYGHDAEHCGYKKCSKCGYAACKLCSTCAYVRNKKCGYEACDSCGANSCTACEDKEDALQCGYNACTHDTNCTPNKKNVRYIGSTYYTVKKGICSNHQRTITTETHCVFTRVSYYADPSKREDIVTATYTETGGC